MNLYHIEILKINKQSLVAALICYDIFPRT